jgi:negative regulator of flagellin synthesis FlgM
MLWLEGRKIPVKINNFRPTGVNPYNNQQNKMENLAKSKQKKTDVVEISSEAKEMQSISSIEKERQTKVEELKAQVGNGTYKLQANEIAKSIIDYYRK